MHTNELPYHRLANAIILQAVDDYRNALNGTSYREHYTPEQIIEEIEAFFRSEWFEMLTKVKGDYLIARLKEEHRENERRKNESNTDTSNTETN